MDFIYINTVSLHPLGHRNSAATQCEASQFSLTKFHLGDISATVIYAVVFAKGFSVLYSGSSMSTEANEEGLYFETPIFHGEAIEDIVIPLLECQTAG